MKATKTTPSSIYPHGDHRDPMHHIIILGSGFAGVEVLKRLQKRFKK
jgi:hypothetical protein